MNDAKHRLPSLKAGLPLLANPLAPAITGEAERSRYRASTQPYRAWYKTARWQRLRWRVLTRDCFTCAMCGKLEGDARNLVGDHKEPHRGDPVKFWDEDNCQTLCADPCHNKHKQAQEHAWDGGAGRIPGSIDVQNPRPPHPGNFFSPP